MGLNNHPISQFPHRTRGSSLFFLLTTTSSLLSLLKSEVYQTKMRVTIVLALVLVAIIAPATCQRPWWRGQAIKRLGKGQQQFRPNNQWFQQQDPEAAQEMRERMAEAAEREAEAAAELREQEEEAQQELLEQQAEAAQQDVLAAQELAEQEAEAAEAVAEAAEDRREQQAEAAEAEAEQQGEAAQKIQQEQDEEALQEMQEQEAEDAEDLAEQEAEAAEAEAEAAEELAEQEEEAAEAEAEAREEMQGEAAEGAGEGFGDAGGSAGTSFSAGGSQFGPSMGGSTGGSFFDPAGGFGGSGGSTSMGGSSYGGYQGPSGGSNGVPGGATGTTGGAGGTPGEIPGGGNIGAANGTANGGVNGAPNGAANEAPNGGATGVPNGGANGAPNGAANGAPNGAANGVPNGAPTGEANGTASGAGNGAPNGGTGANGTVNSQGTVSTSQGSTGTWPSSSGTEGIGQSIGSSFGTPNEPNIAFAPAPIAQAPLTPEETAALDNTYMDKHLCGGFLGANGISGKKDLAVLALDYAGMKQALDPCNVPKNGRTTGRTPVNIAFRGGMETYGQDPASAVLRDLPGMVQRYQQTPKKVHLFSWYMPSEHALRSLLTKKSRGGLANTEVVLGYVEESKMALFSALLGDTTFTNLLGQLQQAGISVNRVCDTCKQIANMTTWQRKRQGLVNGVGVFNQQGGQCGPVAEVPATDQLALSAPQCQNFQDSMGSCIFDKLAAICPWLRRTQTASEQPLAAIMESWAAECGKQLSCWQGKGAYLSFLARSAASCGVSQYGASAAIGQCVSAGQNAPLDPAPTQPSM